MIKFAVDQWDKNKKRLENNILNNLEAYNEFSYSELVGKVVDFIFNDEDSKYSDDEYDSKNITEIDNGDYQGTLLYLIPLKTYQPSEDGYLMTYVGYGSCSGCDTLQSIQMWSFDDEDISDDKKKKFVKDIMGLCLDLVQNTIKPYNNGWRNDSKYDAI